MSATRTFWLTFLDGLFGERLDPGAPNKLLVDDPDIMDDGPGEFPRDVDSDRGDSNSCYGDPAQASDDNSECHRKAVKMAGTIVLGGLFAISRLIAISRALWRERKSDYGALPKGRSSPQRPVLCQSDG
jgi:hypothetical protein